MQAEQKADQPKQPPPADQAQNSAPSLPPTPPILPTPANVSDTGKQPIAVTVQMPREDRTWDVVNIATSGFVGLAAACIGAYLTYRFTANWSAKTKANEEKERNEFAIFTMHTKLSSLYSGLDLFKQMLAAGRAEMEKEGGSYLSMFVRAATNNISPILFTPEELYRTGKLCPPSFINGIMLLDEHCNGRSETLALYSQERARFDKSIQGEVKDGVITIEMTKEESKRIEMEAVRLDILLESIERNIEIDRKRAYEAILQLQKAKGTLIGKESRIQLKDLNGQEVVVSALTGTATPIAAD